MSKRLSLRVRLTVWYSFALGLGLAMLALAIWLSMRHMLLSDIDQTLVDDAQSVQSFASHEAGEPGVKLSEELDEYFHAYPRDTFLFLQNQSGSIRYASFEPFPFRFVPSPVHALRTDQWNKRNYRVLAKTVPIGGDLCTLVIASPLNGVERVLRRLGLLLVSLAPLIVIAATIGGNWLSRRALKPVDEITKAARSIRIGSLSERLQVPRTGDELERLSETLNEMLARLEAAVKSLSRFTADASHEIRTPLAVIRATAEIAARRSRSAESYRDALLEIVAESERMTQLVDDLLFLARCDAEAAEMPMLPLDLGALATDVCSRMRTLAEAKCIRLTCSQHFEVFPILGNETAIRRLVLALVDNALKYTPAGGAVRVSLARDAESVTLAVSDTGPGVAEWEKEAIFDRFYRTSDAREHVHTGFGLGLALAAGIAQRHGAHIEVDTPEGGGAQFRVSFRSQAHRYPAGDAGPENSTGTALPRSPASA